MVYDLERAADSAELVAELLSEAAESLEDGADPRGEGGAYELLGLALTNLSAVWRAAEDADAELRRRRGDRQRFNPTRTRGQPRLADGGPGSVRRTRRRASRGVERAARLARRVRSVRRTGSDAETPAGG